MSAPRTKQPSALAAVRRIGERRLDSGLEGDLPKSLHASLAPVFLNLRDATGDDGCSALSSRAFAQCEWDHPAVATMRGPTDCEITLERVIAAVDAHGAAATASGAEALLSALFEILARIIGEDMAISIMDQERSRPAQRDGGSQ